MKAVIKQTVQNRLDEGMFRTREFWVVIKAANGEVVWTSETYSQKHNAMENIKSTFGDIEIEDTTKEE